MEITVPALTKAEENISITQHLVRDLHHNFVKLGGLLLENQQSAYWSQCGHESFKDFIQMLGISYSLGTRLIALARIVAQQLLTEDEVAEIGVSKAVLLLPRFKDGSIDRDTVELAKNAPYRDLLIHLGCKVSEEESEEYLLCPRCGADITLTKSLIRRR